MKTRLKYSLLAVMAGLFLVNVSGRGDRRQGDERMPVVPNGDFEDSLKVWKGWTNFAYGGSKFASGSVIRGTRNVYQGKYCMVLSGSAEAKNTFPISIHPSSLHAYIMLLVSCGKRYDEGSISIELFKNGVVVDKGNWAHDSTSINQWTEITIPISNAATEIDSARISLHVSSFDNLNATVFRVDDLFFK